MTQTQMETELTRVCSASRSTQIEDLLWWLGREAIKNPRARANGKSVFVGCIDPSLSIKELVDKDEDKVKNLVHRARKFIESFYEQEGVEGDVWLELPDNLAEREPVGKKGAYGMRFGMGPRPTRDVRKAATKTKLRPAAAFWNAMFCSVRSRRSLLIYPADPVDRLSGRKIIKDDRGLDSGSGEVAGAFLIGACTANLQQTIDVRRSCDVNAPELQVPSSCFIYLGSSMKCNVLRDLRERKPWKNVQSFHFEKTKDRQGGEVGSIFDGELGKRPKHIYSYKVKRLRDHEIDYALISFFQNKDDCQALIALQGISTIATWAGAQFMCDDSRINELRSELRKRFAMSSTDSIPSFELLLEVVVKGYRPEEVKIIDLRLH